MANTIKGVVEEILNRRMSNDRMIAYDQFVLKYGSFDYPKFALFDVRSTAYRPKWREFGLAIDESRTAQNNAGLHVGDCVEVTFDLSASQNMEGRWFGSANAWKVESTRKKPAQKPMQQQAQPAQQPAQQQSEAMQMLQEKLNLPEPEEDMPF